MNFLDDTALKGTEKLPKVLTDSLYFLEGLPLSNTNKKHSNSAKENNFFKLVFSSL